MLFLRKLLRIELKRNGQLLKVIKRDFEEDQCIVQDGSETKLWYLFRGSFEMEAEALRAEPSSQIEPKRKAKMIVALPEKDADIEGVLCAFLPTQHRTGLPFHINADFFPSSDRKTIQFDRDYQGRWNEAAVRAAAVVLAAALPSLPELLGHRVLWRLLSRMESVHREASAGRRDTVLKEFWEKAQSKIGESKVVYTSTSQWQYPRSVLLLEKEEEQESLPILESIGLEIVHPDLRSQFQFFARSRRSSLRPNRACKSTQSC